MKSSIIAAILVTVQAIKDFIFGKDTSHLNGDVLFPGQLNFANKGGEYFHGSKVKFFFTVRGINEWCLPGNEGHNALVAEIIPTLFGYILVYNRKLTRKDEDTIDRFGRAINEKIREENAKHEVEQAAIREEEEKKAVEAKYFEGVGRKYEARVAKIKSESIGKERERLMKELNAGDLKDE